MCLEQVKRIINMICSKHFAIEHFVDFMSILYGDLKKEEEIDSITNTVRSSPEVSGVTDRSAGASQFC